MKQIRLWKLGNLEKMWFPKREAVEKLCYMIAMEKPDETLNIAWGPDLQLEVYDVEKASESENYINYVVCAELKPEIIKESEADE